MESVINVLGSGVCGCLCPFVCEALDSSMRYMIHT